MKFDRRSKRLASIFAICAIFIVSGYLYLDIRLARFITEAVGDRVLLSKPVSNIPDLLLLLVCALTAASWAIRFSLSRKPYRFLKLEFLEYVGSALPLAFLLKAVLKDIFGRTNTRVWLLHPDQIGFHWFQGGGDFSGFPSGHMAVFTVLMIGIGRYFPRLRFYCGALLLGLAAALIITQYHFLSDVAAGVSVGVLIDLLVRAGLPFLHRLAARRRVRRPSRSGFLEPHGTMESGVK